MRTTVFAMALVSASAAYADQASEVTAKALTCWDVPAGLDEPLEPIVFDVEFSPDGYLNDVTVQNFTRDQPRAKVYVIFAMRALQKCVPFEGASGTVRIVLDVKNIPPRKGAIDPFKE